MARESRLPAGGMNLFQEIKAVCAKAEAAGQQLVRLSIGQPEGPAFLKACVRAAEAVMSDAQAMHEYQDNGCLPQPDFAERFVQAHVKTDIKGREDVRCLPVPGVKPMLGLVPLACGSAGKYVIRVATMTSPGYPTPADWCRYLEVDTRSVTLTIENKFRFADIPRVNLVMVNYPHNPSGQVASRDWWSSICEQAEENNVRLFNDAAYSMLAHTDEHCTLTDVAVNFPKLSWAEAFSASKAGNFTGWRVGAIAGSPDFVGDIATIKGNTDSGLVAPMAHGALHVFENHPELIRKCQETYRDRISFLVEMLEGYGMRLAVKPAAGFFTLWQVPKVAFGEEVRNAAHFNFMMIERTGIVGVHFHPYVRYAVCGDVKQHAEKINGAFREANVQYA